MRKRTSTASLRPASHRRPPGVVCLSFSFSGLVLQAEPVFLRGSGRGGGCLRQPGQFPSHSHRFSAEGITCGPDTGGNTHETLPEGRRVSVPGPHPSWKEKDIETHCPLGRSWCKEVTCPVLLCCHEAPQLFLLLSVGHSALYFLGFSVSKEGRPLSLMLPHFHLRTG